MKITAPRQSEQANTIAAVRRAAVQQGAREWARTWLELSRADWTSLVLVPASPGAGAPAIGAALQETAARYGARRTELVDATDATTEGWVAVADTIRARAAAGSRVIVALGDVAAHPQMIAIARAADVALLLVPLGDTPFAAARDAIESVGRERFIGSIAVRPAR